MAQLKEALIVLAWLAVNVFLVWVTRIIEVPIFLALFTSVIGATIGVASDRRRGSVTNRALAGSAIAIFLIFAFVMSIFARIFER